MFWTWNNDEIPAWEGAEGTARRLTLPLVVCAEAPFTTLVASWNATLPPGTLITPAVRVRLVGGGWTPWHALARWGQGEHPTTGERLPRSLPVDRSGPAWVDIDTLRLRAGSSADAFQLRVWAWAATRPPHLHQLAVTTYRPGANDDPVPASSAVPQHAPAIHLAVPERSQRVEDPAIAGLICSPTALGMVMAYWGVVQSTAEVVAGVRDGYGEETYGNWPFNTAYAGSLGLQAHVRHFPGLDAVEAELRAGHPVILSVAWEAGELPDAPIPQSNGHLIVATGVTAEGDFTVNDPAADPRTDQPIARCYRRADLARVANGIGYVVTKRET